MPHRVAAAVQAVAAAEKEVAVEEVAGAEGEDKAREAWAREKAAVAVAQLTTEGMLVAEVSEVTAAEAAAVAVQEEAGKEVAV